jgi:hypothetical protein
VCCLGELHLDDDAEYRLAAAFEYHDLIGVVACRGGVLIVTTHQQCVEATRVNRALTDSVGLNVLSPFLPLSAACTLSTSETADQSTVFVVTDSEPGGDLGSPTVVHRVRGG